jgi:hypothetical protein
MRGWMVVVCCALTLVACNGTLPPLPTTIEAPSAQTAAIKFASSSTLMRPAAGRSGP